jgi:ribosomal protein L17
VLEKEQKMIAYTCSMYQSLQTEHIAAEESHHQLLSEAQDQHHITKAKGSKAKLVKRHVDRLISLALEGMFASHSSTCGSGKLLNYFGCKAIFLITTIIDLQLFDTNMKQVISC